jgi:chorismate mutase/prephenate dehydratase
MVVIQGITGSYSEEAAMQLVGKESKILFVSSFAEGFRLVLQGEADYGVFPLRNKIIGEIKPVVSGLEMSGLRIYDRLKLKIDHVLIGLSELSEIRFVYSQKEALLQCRKFFLRNPFLKQVESSDTALSVREVLEKGLPENAAIASRRAAAVYGGRIICEDVADDRENWTLFCLFGR